MQPGHSPPSPRPASRPATTGLSASVVWTLRTLLRVGPASTELPRVGARVAEACPTRTPFHVSVCRLVAVELVRITISGGDVMLP